MAWTRFYGHYVTWPLGNCLEYGRDSRFLLEKKVLLSCFGRDTMLHGHWVTVGVVILPQSPVLAGSARAEAAADEDGGEA